MPLTVGELSRLTGVTVRALHHYDEIGLCRPSQRTAAGYRLYDDADVRRLQQVLVFRELGVPLDEIAAAIDDGGDERALLLEHREVLMMKRNRIDAMVAAVDAALGHLEKGSTMMTNDEMKQLFDGFDPARYEDEVQERWGETDAYRESSKRTRGYGKAEWQQIKVEAEAIGQDLAALKRAAVAPGDARVKAVLERHRQHIDRWFYPCSPEMQRRLGDLYVNDARFQTNIDKTEPGLAQYWHDALNA